MLDHTQHDPSDAIAFAQAQPNQFTHEVVRSCIDRGRRTIITLDAYRYTDNVSVRQRLLIDNGCEYFRVRGMLMDTLTFLVSELRMDEFPPIPYSLLSWHAVKRWILLEEMGRYKGLMKPFNRTYHLTIQ